jgi:hypothetical protein
MQHKRNRRDFLRTSVAATLGVGMDLAAIGSPCATAADAAPREPARLAALRRAAQRRCRRLIYNNDGEDIAEPGADTREGFLSKRSKPILGTQVDSVFYCTGATTMFAHLAKVGETYGEFCPDGSEGAIRRKNVAALKAAGHDPLAVTADFCHRNELEIFFSHRINDIHDSFLDWEFSRWKREHPQFLMGTITDRDKSGGVNSPRYWWSSLDFEKPEVFDYLCRIQKDVCGRYDIDGVEIDYFRSPMFFRPNLDFQPATPAQVEILTGFHRQLRAMHLAAGTKRGRPILTAARVPATLAACRHVGIDIKQWLQEGLIDVLTVGGGYVPFTEPLEEIIQLAHSVHVPAYPTISASGMRGPDNRYSSLEAWRGAAANMWRGGADGIVMFNLFPSGPEPRLMDIGSSETLAGRNKLFVIDPVRVLEGDLVQGMAQTQALPLTIPGDGNSATAILPIGDDLPAAAKNKNLAGADLRVHLSNGKALDVVEVKLNGAVLTPAEKSVGTGWLTFRPLGEQYRPGRNEIGFRTLRPTANGKPLAEVLHVEVAAIYK